MVDFLDCKSCWIKASAKWNKMKKGSDWEIKGTRIAKVGESHIKVTKSTWEAALCPSSSPPLDLGATKHESSFCDVTVYWPLEGPWTKRGCLLQHARSPERFTASCSPRGQRSSVTTTGNGNVSLPPLEITEAHRDCIQCKYKSLLLCARAAD